MNLPIDIDGVKGFLDPDEGKRLYELALECSKRAPCMEIGGYCGKSTVYLGTGCKLSGGGLFSIDHHQGSEEHQKGEEYFDSDLYDFQEERVDTFREFRKTIRRADLLDTVIPLVSKSTVVARSWRTSLSLLFIDGGHSWETALSDYQSWASHVLPGGILAIHDLFPDPSKGGQAPINIYRLAIESGLFEAMSGVKTLGILRKITP